MYFHELFFVEFSLVYVFVGGFKDHKKFVCVCVGGGGGGYNPLFYPINPVNPT